MTSDPEYRGTYGEAEFRSLLVCIFNKRRHTIDTFGKMPLDAQAIRACIANLKAATAQGLVFNSTPMAKFKAPYMHALALAAVQLVRPPDIGANEYACLHDLLSGGFRHAPLTQRSGKEYRGPHPPPPFNQQSAEGIETQPPPLYDSRQGRQGQELHHTDQDAARTRPQLPLTGLSQLATNAAGAYVQNAAGAYVQNTLHSIIQTPPSSSGPASEPSLNYVDQLRQTAELAIGGTNALQQASYLAALGGPLAIAGGAFLGMGLTYGLYKLLSSRSLDRKSVEARESYARLALLTAFVELKPWPAQKPRMLHIPACLELLQEQQWHTDAVAVLMQVTGVGVKPSTSLTLSMFAGDLEPAKSDLTFGSAFA